jgi:protein TonB
MIAKKNPKLNDEKNRVVYFQLGLFLTSAGMLMAFSWKSPKYDNYNFKEEQIASVPEEEVYVEKEEFPEVKPLKTMKKSTPVDPVITAKIDPVSNIDDDPKLIDINTIKVDVSDSNGEGGGAPGFDDILVDIPDKDAYLEGGIMQYLSSNLVYPEVSVRFQEEGKVYVSFIIEKDGTPSQIKVMENSVKSKELREEALRVIQEMPAWEPAELQGEKVRTKVYVPIVFALE